MGEGTISGSKSSTKSKNVREITAAPGEQELTDMQQGFLNETSPQYQSLIGSGTELIDTILGGGQLPGFLGTLQAGINPEVTQSLVDKSLNDIRPGLQASGLLDSGVRAELEAQTASGIRRDSEFQNLSILQNLLSLGLGSIPAFTGGVLGTQELLGQRLAGLRGITDTAKQRTSQYGGELTVGFGG